MKRLFIHSCACLLFLLVVFACGCTPAAGSAGESWTVSLYVCGSDLETYNARASETLAELLEADIPANVNVVVQTGGARKWRTEGISSAPQRFAVRDHQLWELDKPVGSSMGDPNTLSDFLRYCAEQYPAHRTAVILWDHGGGPMKGICFDEVASYDALTLSDLDEAFSIGRAAKGDTPYDIIGMDACLMASLEVATTLEDDGRYLIASQDTEPGNGWDYRCLFQALASQDSFAISDSFAPVGSPASLDSSSSSDSPASVGSPVPTNSSASTGSSSSANSSASSDSLDAIPEVCRTICDGYYAACASRDKQRAATLSVVDLSKIPAVNSALDDAMKALASESAYSKAALRVLASGARDAEKFGGTTENEGSCSLVDLYGLSRVNLDEGTFEALAASVDDAVIYNIAGETNADVHGLSIFYPVTFDAVELAAYCEQTPLTVYGKMLETLFSSASRGIRFDDSGSMDEEGNFRMTLSADSKENVYDVFVVNQCADGPTYKETNLDVKADGDTGSFWHSLDTFCNTLDGMPLDISAIEQTDSYIIYSAPITHNGRETNIRFCEFKDPSAPNGRRYEVMGTWDGIDEVSGLSDRLQCFFENGDTIGTLSKSTGQVREERVIDGTVEIGESPLASGTYECWFVVVDLYGNTYESAKHTFVVSE